MKLMPTFYRGSASRTNPNSKKLTPKNQFQNLMFNEMLRDALERKSPDRSIKVTETSCETLSANNNEDIITTF